MKIKNIKDVETFLNIVDHCNGEVTLTSIYGDKFNMKSKLTQYVAISALLGEHGDELELWCSEKTDEEKFLKMFSDHPEMVWSYYNVTHSKCYIEYGLKRTGCAGCPFGRDFEYELEVIKKYEPKLYKAVNNIFGKSYEYTRKYKQFCKEMKNSEHS